MFRHLSRLKNEKRSLKQVARINHKRVSRSTTTLLQHQIRQLSAAYIMQKKHLTCGKGWANCEIEDAIHMQKGKRAETLNAKKKRHL